ncbi:MAG TPA: helix-turn-helix domain-containing protein [Woeseiaceae bacterium]|nr:helix-turn-helix domain-containing protein [Woeseiaceae bacterium]
MDNQPDFSALRDAVRRLEAAGVVPAVQAPLLADADRLTGELRQAVLAEAPAFTDSGNPDVIPELEQHLDAHVREACRLLGGGLPGDLAFVREHAERRASQKFPLDALLQSYSILHRTLANWIREAALGVADESAHLRRVVAAITDFVIEYTGTAGNLLTSEYVHHTRRLAGAEADRRSALLNTLLDGYDEADQAAAGLLRRAGYLQQRQSYCVALARSVDPGEMESPPRAQRMADAIAGALEPAGVRSIIGIRDNLVVAILSATRRTSGWTAPQSSVADRVYPALRRVGPAALIGLSNDAPSTSHIPKAANEARLALDLANVSNRVARYSDISLRQMLITRARDAAPSSQPAWAEKLIAADKRGALAATLRSYADCNMNAQKTALLLGIHPNTVYSRIQKVERLTGLNALRFHALSELLLALDWRQ